MKCPSCKRQGVRVLDSRPDKLDCEIRRRRECQECNHRFTTYERIEQLPIIIVKKDNRREEFNRIKILAGIQKACEKRAISTDLIEEVVNIIERNLRDTNESEISSNLVGEEIMKALKKLDAVAYVRFASVYREFKDTDDFVKELKVLSTK